MVALSALAALAALASPQSALIVNQNFADGLNGWSVATYGAKLTIEVVAAARDGKPAVKISTPDPSDAAIGQDISVKPGSFYRLEGWVKTQDLDPHGAPVCGTFQVQRPGGQAVIASGANHSGVTDWSRVDVDFVAPADGKARVAIFFCGWGHGTGSAWFSGLTLTEMDLADVPVTIETEPICRGSIEQGQCGQFIEYLCTLVPGMWAEKLDDGSFEGITPYKFVFIKETDSRDRPWYPCGMVNRSTASRVAESPVTGDTCEKIVINDGPPAIAGIRQDGIAVDKGAACDFSTWARCVDGQAKLRATLRDGDRDLASAEFAVGRDWGKVSAQLVPTASATNAHLDLEFEGPGTIWLDDASLMPQDNVDGWRPDVVQALKDLRPGVIRVGGSVMDDINLGDFQWSDTVGDPVKRKPFRAWGGLQPVGPGLEEVVNLIRTVGAEPLICVRVTNRTPQDAAEEIQYFNGSADTPMGALRAKNGHPAPWGIKYFQIGNERDGDEYNRRLPPFCDAMHAADPSIKLLSSFPTDGAMKAAGDRLDFLCPHHYGCKDLNAMANDFLDIRRMIRDFGHGRDIKVAVTEWNTTAGDAGPARAMLWNLDNALACARYQNLMHRNCDLVKIANRSNLTNSFCSGIIQTDNHRMYLTPTYYAQQMYSTLAGATPLKIGSDVPVDAAPDFSATLSADGKSLTLFAVNETGNDISRPIDLGKLKPTHGQIEVWTLADSQNVGMPDVVNDFDHPHRVGVVKSSAQLDSDKLTMTFPRWSIVAIRVPLGG